MPRPKRTKVVPALSKSTPKARASTSSTIQQPLRGSTQGLSSSAEIVSDDSQGLVTSRPRSHGRESRPSQEGMMMSGALGVGDIRRPTTRPTRNTRTELSRVAREGDHARAIEGLKKRRDEALGRAKGDQVLRMPSSVAEKPLPSVEHDDRQTTIGSRPTPMRDEPVFDIANFKRRQRQPSILRMLQAQQANERDDNAVSASEDDFQPDDESTPLNLSKSVASLQPGSTSATPSIPNDDSCLSRKRKLSSPEVQVPKSSPPEKRQRSLDAAVAQRSPPTHTELQSRQDISLARKRKTTPVKPSQTMRPPASSPLDAEMTATPLHDIAPEQSRVNRSSAQKPRHPITSNTLHSLGAERAIGLKAMSESSSTRHLRGEQRSKPRQSLSTAALQDLLPRRRRRRHNVRPEFDILSSDVDLDTGGLATDDDELLVMPANRLKPSRHHPASNKMARATTARAQRSKRSVAAVGQSGPKTYARRSISDKENSGWDEAGAMDQEEDSLGPVANDGSSVSIEAGRRAPSRELRAARQKFEEVDQWSLDFEAVVATSSSPYDAR
ncbi:MAG: hypothetical protein M1817_001287 [Caeruleum heppii]|nr:MAG: hypothetical protein M1817_001287 [Caeruleum heppii]